MYALPVTQPAKPTYAIQGPWNWPIMPAIWMPTHIIWGPEVSVTPPTAALPSNWGHQEPEDQEPEDKPTKPATRTTDCTQTHVSSEGLRTDLSCVLLLLVALVCAIQYSKDWSTTASAITDAMHVNQGPKILPIHPEKCYHRWNSSKSHGGPKIGTSGFPLPPLVPEDQDTWLLYPQQSLNTASTDNHSLSHWETHRHHQYSWQMKKSYRDYNTVPTLIQSTPPNQQYRYKIGKIIFLWKPIHKIRKKLLLQRMCRCQPKDMKYVKRQASMTSLKEHNNSLATDYAKKNLRNAQRFQSNIKEAQYNRKQQR